MRSRRPRLLGSQPGGQEPGDVGLAVAWEFADLMGGSVWYERLPTIRTPASSFVYRQNRDGIDQLSGW